MMVSKQLVSWPAFLLLAACAPTAVDTSEERSKDTTDPQSLSCFNVAAQAEFVVGVADWKLITSDAGSPYYLASDGSAYFPQGGDRCRIVARSKS